MDAFPIVLTDLAGLEERIRDLLFFNKINWEVAAGQAVEDLLHTEKAGQRAGVGSRGSHGGRSAGRERSRSDKAGGTGKPCCRNAGTGRGDCMASLQHLQSSFWLILVSVP